MNRMIFFFLNELQLHNAVNEEIQTLLLFSRSLADERRVL